MELSHENGASPDLAPDGPDDVRPDVQQEPPRPKRRRDGKKERDGFTWDSDAFATRRRLLELLAMVEPAGWTLDPFGARHSIVEAGTVYHLDQGEDAYRLTWDVEAFNRIYANGPFSGQNSKRTAEKIVEQILRARSMVVYNMTIACAGSEYWKESIWPHARAIAWLGREDFIAPPGHPSAGKELAGNRNEMALVQSGTADAADVQRFARIMSTVGGYPVTIVGPS